MAVVSSSSRVSGTYVGEGIAMLGEGVIRRVIEMAASRPKHAGRPLAVTDEVSLG